MKIRPEVNLQIHLTRPELGQSAAQLVLRLSAQGVAARGRFTVALSGGSLPKIVGPPLVTGPVGAQIDWTAWHVFWADERCVPLTDSASNYRLARETIFDQAGIPASQIYALDDRLDPAAAASVYQAALAQLFQPAAGQRPRFDLILLGMGEDGHTASLFPGHPLLQETEQWVVPIFDSPKPPPARISLTLPVINNARRVAFLAAGSGKAEVLPRVLGLDRPANPLPSRRVKPVDGELYWFVDKAAAAKLNSFSRA